MRWKKRSISFPYFEVINHATKYSKHVKFQEETTQEEARLLKKNKIFNYNKP